MIYLAEIAALLNGRLSGEDKPIASISIDSRAIKNGDVFVAVRGARFDGHDFLNQAVAKGAIAAVVEVERPGLQIPQLVVADTTTALGKIAAQQRLNFAGKLIAITGSSGKTSVKGMLREILLAHADVAVTPGNFNNNIGVPLSLMLLKNQAYAVIEIGTNHPGEIAYLTDMVLPDVALVNNIMPAHIGGFGSLAAIAQEKSAIYQRLNSMQTAVINVDDDFCTTFEQKTEHSHRLGFSANGLHKSYPTLIAENICESELGVAFDCVFEDQRVPMRLNVPGRHSVNNALAAAGCAFAAGLSLADIAPGLANFKGEAGRMQLRCGRRDATIVDDTYNANPGSVKAAIDYLSSRSGRRILVLGDLGELGSIAAQVHQELGAYALAKKIDLLCCVGQFAVDTAHGFGGGARTYTVKSTLIDHLLCELAGGVTVLIKGSRSARMEEVVQALIQSEASSC